MRVAKVTVTIDRVSRTFTPTKGAGPLRAVEQAREFLKAEHVRLSRDVDTEAAKEAAASALRAPTGAPPRTVTPDPVVASASADN